MGGCNNVITGTKNYGRMHGVGGRLRIGHQPGTELLRRHTTETTSEASKRVSTRVCRMANSGKESLSLAELISSCCSCVTPKTKRKEKEISSREEEQWEGRCQHFLDDQTR